MKTLNEIREERQANAAKVAELNEKIDGAVNSWRTKKPFPDDFTALSAELATAKKIGLILKNNYNNRLAAEVLPALVEVLKKYNGKKYGEKTREKMGEEFKAMTGCRFYLSRYSFSQKCNSAHIYEMRAAFNKAVDAYNALTVNGIDHEKRA